MHQKRRTPRVTPFVGSVNNIITTVMVIAIRFPTILVTRDALTTTQVEIGGLSSDV